MSGGPEELRAAVAGLIATRAGLEPGAVAERMEAARRDERFADETVQAFVDGGSYISMRPGARRVQLEDLGILPPSQELEDALDRRRGRALRPVERIRLGKLYGALGKVEKAASCFREVLASPEPPPLPLVIELADLAARAGAPALALAGVDRVAESILTRDPAEPAPPGGDLLRDDPLGAAALLERARDVALLAGTPDRAAAIARAATSLYERLGRQPELRRSLAGQVEAQLAAVSYKKARLAAERWRDLAREGQAMVDEAAAVARLGKIHELRGELLEAADLAQECDEILTELEDSAGALAHAVRRCELLARQGALTLALDAYRATAARARQALQPGLALSCDLGRLRLLVAMGQQVAALGGCEELRQAYREREDQAGEDQAMLLTAEALAAAGDLERARVALQRVGELAGGDEGRRLAVLGELAEIEGRAGDGRLLYLSAANLLRTGDREGEAQELELRSAELAQLVGDATSAERVLKRLDGCELPNRIESRLELLRASLGHPDEAEILFEELVDGLPPEASLLERSLLQAALCRLHAARGEPAEAAPGLVALLDDLVAFKETLPSQLQRAFLRSRVCRPIVASARPVAEADQSVTGLLKQLR